ncbi:FAD-linked sulfhydryl oxidase [Microdochium nivale]|nr:FAD-linked sulfhydryl oxidase [Microdochium nivale]
MARLVSMMVIMVVACFLGLSFMMSFGGSATSIIHLQPPSPAPPAAQGKAADTLDVAAISPDLLSGSAVAPKIENATLKAELGRASWKLFHTMMARFPEEPTADDSLALKSYIHLFARLYPCGDCARHFQGLLVKYPPQTSSRNVAAGWACHVHNQVNKRLKKPEFDCNNIGDFYDCGCGDDKKKEESDQLAQIAASS